MPAGLLPPRREKLFADVSSRYLEPVHREKKEYVPPPRTTYETQRAWAGTQSRWANALEKADSSSARHGTPQKEKKPEQADPLAGWNQAAEHRTLARRTIGSVGARYLEDAEAKGHPKVSPRLAVEKKDDETKLETGWRGTHALNKHTDFDVMYKNWLKKHANDKFMQRKKNSARSPVADYFRHGTPIESTSRHGTPSRAGSAPPAANRSGGGGGADGKQHQHGGGGANQHRTQSPWERGVSPDSFLAGRWKGAGVTVTGFDVLQKQTVKAQRQMALQEEHARQAVEHLKEVKVDKSFVPRVAKLALVYQIPQLQRDSSSQALSRKGSSGLYNIRGGSNSPANRSPRDSPSRRL